MASSKKRRRHDRPPPDHYYCTEDIVAAILPRLAPKSLIRFRCVSKSWSALISSPAFSTKQLRQNHTKSLMLLRSPHNLESIDLNASLLKEDYKINEGGLVAKRSCGRVHNDLPTSGERKIAGIVGSCNGLICLTLSKPRDRRDFLLWNPCTRVTKKLQKIDLPFSRPRFHGFGYDSTTDDYKVMFGCGSYTIAIFSLRTGHWRAIPSKYDRVYCTNSQSRGCLLNGILHWVNMEWREIVSFRFGNQKFQEAMPLPNIESDQIEIGTMKDSLCAYHWGSPSRSDSGLTIWVMNNYGVHESWARHIQIRIENFPCSCIRPIFILENGEVLLMLTSMANSLVLYNPKEKAHRIVKGDSIARTLILYVETLVSPILGC